jgi:hypothetical protein
VHRLLIACLLACGDNARRAPAAIDAAIDAPVPDAFDPFSCMSPTMCGQSTCCLLCSPGGACYSTCTSSCATGMTLCDPGQPCTSSTGTPGVCQQQHVGFNGQYTVWICQ